MGVDADGAIGAVTVEQASARVLLTNSYLITVLATKASQRQSCDGSPCHPYARVVQTTQRQAFAACRFRSYPVYRDGIGAMGATELLDDATIEATTPSQPSRLVSIS